MLAAVVVTRAEPLDELTLRRAQRGDERAWRTLIDRYQKPVHALVWRMLAGRAQHRAPDLTQETFVRVLKALPSFDPAGPATLTTWILTIAARLVLNELRRPDAVALEPAHEPAAADRADDQTERAQLGAAIAAAMAELPYEQRAVVVLREFHELAYEDIAALLDVDVGTVKSRLSRARGVLRERLRRMR